VAIKNKMDNKYNDEEATYTEAAEAQSIDPEFEEYMKKMKEAKLEKQATSAQKAPPAAATAENKQEEEETVIMQSSTKTKVAHLLNDTTQCYQDTDEMEGYETEEQTKWIPIEHRVPDILQWGEGLMWYQVNGDIVLGGIGDATGSHMVLRGYIEFQEDEIDDDEVNETIDRMVQSSTGENTSELEEQIKLVRESQKCSKAAKKTIQTEFVLNKTQGTAYDGLHERVVMVEQSNGLILRTTTVFKIVANIVAAESKTL